MDITPALTRADLEDYHRLDVVTHDHDFVGMPADPLDELLPLLDTPETAGELTRIYLGRRDGVAVCGLLLRYPTLDNLSSVNLDLIVDPTHRRQGCARELVSFALGQIKEAGRTRVFMEVPSFDGQPPVARAALEELGARNVLEDTRRMLDLEKHPPLPRGDVPAGYRIVQWLDVCPEELVDGAAYLMARMVMDAPMGEMDYEPEKWDAARYREKEASAQSRNRRRMATVAVHVASGQLAGYTDIGVNASRTETAYQWDTIVDPDHRGHGLGLVLKTWNHAQLVEQVAGVRYLNTWNAQSNSFMIAVNEAMGFEPRETWTEYQLDL